MKIVIDPTRCQGHGTCAALLAEYIEMDKWHYPILSKNQLKDSHMEAAKKAVQLCPELAIKIVEG
ncbi:MAG: ferredoxin [Actinomycetota bacterium]|jgi:ferredoxin|nr:ferredoxin [Actinomycetota bacterium]